MTKQQIIKYLKENKFNIQNANALFLAADIVFKAYANSKIKKVNFSPMFSFFDYSKPNPFYQIIKENDIKRVAEKIYFDYLKNYNSLDVIIKKHQNLTLKLDKIWQEYKKQKKINSKDKIINNIIKKFIKTMDKWWWYGAIGEDKCEVINYQIVPKFQKRHNLTPKKAFELIKILSHPEDQAIFTLERKDFLKICLAIIINKKLKASLLKNNYEIIFQDKKIMKLLDNYIKNYFWIKTNFYQAKQITPKILIKKIYKEISEYSLNKIQNEIKKIDNNFNKIRQQKNRISKAIKLSKIDNDDIYFAKRMIYWLDQRKLGTMKHFYYFLNIITDIARRFDIDYYKLSLYTLDELHKLLTTCKKLSKKELSKRNNKVFIIYEKGKKTKLFYGANAQKMLEIIIQMKIKDKKIKGTVASMGTRKKFTGIIRIVHNPVNAKFNDQDILVTSMTRVEFMPLVRKAKAIITDEGGIGCHAAIVAREMNKPCIIGTKIATQVLKDGDLVEVDADKGVIKILKNKLK